jgi:integrase
MIRSNTLTYPQILKITERLLNKNLSLYDQHSANALGEHDYDKVQQFAKDKCDRIIKRNRELLAKKKCVEANQGKAQKILEENGISVEQDSIEFCQFCEEVSKARIIQYEVIKSRINGDFHPYEQELKQKKRSNTLQEVMAEYIHRREKTAKGRGLTKFPEKFKKIIDCFEYETGEKEVLLSDIDNALTLKIAERLAKYPLYRKVRYAGKSLDEIYALKDVDYPSYITVSEEISLLASVYKLAIKRFDGLDRNYAEDLIEVVLGNQKVKESAYRDIFRPEDIQVIIEGLISIKRKYFHTSPHLFLIPLIALYQGMRVNEICQLYIEDIINVDGIWCIDNNENVQGKSLKNTNSIRLNPIHNDLIKIGLISFVEVQRKRGYSRLWEGVQTHSCDYYDRQGNHSHYFDKWFNGTFKSKLKLSNPEKQSFHSFRHTFLNWFKQNVNLNEHGQAITALSGHLDQDDIRAFGFDQKSMAFIRYGKELNVKNQQETLKLLNYGIDIKPLKIDV